MMMNQKTPTWVRGLVSELRDVREEDFIGCVPGAVDHAFGYIKALWLADLIKHDAYNRLKNLVRMVADDRMRELEANHG